jgi:hypothetical protein
MSIIHPNRSKNKITTLFEGKIDLSDVNPADQHSHFLTRVSLLIPYTIWPMLKWRSLEKRSRTVSMTTASTQFTMMPENAHPQFGSPLPDTPGSDSSLTSTCQVLRILTYANEVAVARLVAYDGVSRCYLSITN